MATFRHLATDTNLATVILLPAVAACVPASGIRLNARDVITEDIRLDYLKFWFCGQPGPCTE
jgi:hypothetical protein